MIDILQTVEIEVIVAVTSTAIITLLGYLIKKNATKSDVDKVQTDLDHHKTEDTNALIAIKERLDRGSDKMEQLEIEIRENRESTIRQEEKQIAHDELLQEIRDTVRDIRDNGKH